MLAEFKDLIARNAPTLLPDAAGLASLVLLLVVGLHLPGLI